MQSPLVCSGCRTILLYPRGATNVCCAVCNNLTPVPPPGTEMAQLICGCCRTLLMHPRGATSVRCACCHTVNLVPGTNLFSYLQCCLVLIIPSIKCVICHYITHVNAILLITGILPPSSFSDNLLPPKPLKTQAQKDSSPESL
nr:protein LOL1-like [Solanum lycopersicum]